MTSKHIYLILALVFFAIFVGLTAAANWTASPVPTATSTPSVVVITTFEECIAAGNPAMESYPRQCRTAEGQLFVEQIAPVAPVAPAATSTGQASGAACVRAGCSNVVCTDAETASTIVTTCIYKEEYACYASARCERQSNGKCGWTQTPALTACLANPPAS